LVLKIDLTKANSSLFFCDFDYEKKPTKTTLIMTCPDGMTLTLA
jgi:hypothetical protein